MSRTRKDAPFWVRLNRIHTSTNHDHLNLGKKVYFSRPVLDENGDRMYDTVAIHIKASVLAKHVCPEWNTPEAYFHGSEHFRLLRKADVPSWSCTDISFPRNVFQRARELCANGYEDELMYIDTYERLRTEEYLAYEYKDYCTEGEPDTQYFGRHRGLMNPCTPNWTHDMPFPSGISRKKGFYTREHYGHERVNARDILKDVAKGYNSGEDIEEFEDDIHSTTAQHRHSMAWLNW